MSRCVCCNNVLHYGEMMKKKPDGTREDMCSSCLNEAFHSRYVEDKPLSILTEWNILSRQLFTTYKE